MVARCIQVWVARVGQRPGLGPTNILRPIITIQFQTFETTSKIIDKPESNYQRPSAAKHYQLEFLRFRVESKMGKSIFDLRVVTKISWVFSGGV